MRRPWAIAFVLLAMWIIGHYWSIGIVDPWSPRLDSKPLPAQVVRATSGPVADGAKVFHFKGCEYCHRVEGYGGICGPDLTEAGDRLTGHALTRQSRH